MHGVIISIFFLLCFLLPASGAEKCLFKSDFTSHEPLKGWVDISQKTPPLTKNCSIVEMNGIKVLQTAKSYFGLFHRLRQPVKINDKLKKITLRVVLLQKNENRGNILGLALSSRDKIALDAGQAFWHLRDSGIQVQGYIYSLQKSNLILYRKEGKEIRAPKPVPPFNLLPAHNQWVVWTLVYDHQKKELAFYNDEIITKPVVKLHQVDIQGTELNSVWICSWGTCYRNIEVTCDQN